METTQIALRLPTKQLKAIDKLAPGVHASRSDLIRRAIELYLYRLACEKDAAIYQAMPLTEEELAFARDPAVWKTWPKW
jgi:metal-responsive CopG/Arc/MetJ family transcriptional regulator